jgi:hypothetical protein
MSRAILSGMLVRTPKDRISARAVKRAQASMADDARDLPLLAPEANFIRTISSRNEIFERGYSLFNVIADAAVDCRLCVMIEEFYQKQWTIGGIGIQGLKHANLATPNSRKRNYFRFAFGKA